MAEKKFFWLKLRLDFMFGDIIDFLMSQKDGANYVVLYQLLCLSVINSNGIMAFSVNEMIIPFDVDKIQRETKYFTKDTIIVALELFKKLGLVMTDNNGISRINNFENFVGGETRTAQIMRDKRKKENIICNNVTALLPASYPKVTQSKSKSKSKEINKDKELYLETVYLKKSEHDKLINDFGIDGTNKIISILDSYKLSSGKTYASDYGAINTWVIDSYKEKQAKEQKTGGKGKIEEQKPVYKFSKPWEPPIDPDAPPRRSMHGVTQEERERIFKEATNGKFLRTTE